MKIFIILLICGICFSSPIHAIILRSHELEKRQYSCGRSSGRLNTRNCSHSSQSIVNGNDAAQGAWPWQLAMFINGGHACGGVLINQNYALTAAHCTNGIPPRSMFFSGGFNNLNHRIQYPQNYWTSGVEYYIQHPYYRHYLNGYDITIIKLANPVTPSALLNTVCLPQQGEILNQGKDCYVTGWGRTQNYNKDYYKNLQETCLPIVSRGNCQSKYKYEITSTMFCAGQGNTTSCQGDSGGPLVCKVGDVWKLYGLVSWGVEGCLGPPPVFAKVAEFVEWVQSNVNR